ncbi:MAG TPA: glycosyl hydrolase 115 family protein, partial [Segetibacter sp.]|nr:glycosyl hydrolase 115 family protein [Segetibacter sp.]
MKKLNLVCCFFLLSSINVFSQNFISLKKQPGAFPIVSATTATTIYTDENDFWLVQKSASLLQNDIEMVTGKKPAIVHSMPSSAQNLIIIGSIPQSSIIQQLSEQKKLNTDQLKRKWEGYHIQLLSNPVKGINNALVITGSDRRGTAYGVFELSEQIGVSPWYWWADVPVKKKSEVYVKAATFKTDAPAVKYRGIFINDEAPAFSGWTKEKFGGVNHQVYEKIFELLLRMKANYLWPAMWGNAFNDDDSLNPILADKYGIVMGTSHHEPMLRAQQEWKRYGKGQWNYTTNDTVLRNFWRKGIENMGTHESIVTVGMRGDGDEPMTSGTATELLERIVKDQRQILQEVTGKPASATPQLWALYKEVQDYYDKGMRVPDDVTLLLCDDNWGNLRKLPKLTDKPRSGGYGIYYHFDYVGGPRNYKWINTNQIERTWEQMDLAYQHGVDKIWI